MSTSTPIQELPFQKGLKAFLERTGRTQTSLAQSIFVAQSSLNNWCRGKADPSVTVALLALEGMTLEELFGKEIADKLLANSKPKEDQTYAAFVTEEANRRGGVMKAESLRKRVKTKFT